MWMDGRRARHDGQQTQDGAPYGRLDGRVTEHPRTDRASGRSPRLFAAVLLAAAGLTAAGTTPAQAAPGVAPVNPVTVPVSGHPANQGFLVFVQGDVRLAADETEGTLAAGGDLAFDTSYNIAAGPVPPDTLTLPGETRPTSLYVGGGITFPTGTGAILRVLGQGLTHIGDTSTYDAFDRDQNGAAIDYRIAPEDTTAETVPRIEGTTRQPATDVSRTADPSVLDFDESFARYRSLSADIGTCPATTALTDAAGRPVTSPVAPGTAAEVELRSGSTTVLTLPASDLDALSLLTFRGLPSPDSPLVVNVTGGTFDGTIPNLANLTSNNAPYVLWNFPEATDVHVTGADALEGTIYAPRANVRWDVTQNIEGNVIAASFVHGVPAAPRPVPLEIHGFPFATTVSCASTDAVTGTLTLTKQVAGGDAAPSDWTLTATGATTISGPSGSAAVTDQTVPAGDYTLSESDGPDGYTAGDWTCSGAEVSDDVVSVQDGDRVVCTIVNTAVVPPPGGGGDGTLTLVKQVVGGDAVPADWTLTATGPTSISGPSGSAAVTGQPVGTGDYLLAESGGPDGYTAGDWTCSGAEVTDDVVSVQDGDQVVCTVVNTAVTPPPPGGGNGGGEPGNGIPGAGGGPASGLFPVPAPGADAGGPGRLDQSGASGTGPGQLAFTGHDPAPSLLIAAASLLGGALLFAARRRSRSHRGGTER
ncbi:hypothetical protein DEI83_07135 [Curtobacterium sp. MCBD17_021]|nr:hypothetical protein DEI83_07135 [Curtobacterium sp. MCBD17_021]